MDPSRQHFYASDFSALCLRRGFSLQKHVAAYCIHRRTVSCDDNVRVLGKGLKFLVAFLISYGWLTFNVRHGINIPSPMLFTFLIELIPVFMAVYLVSQAPSGKLTAALRQMPLPSSARLTVIVILRFVPTVASEFSDVLDAMKTRGLLRSPLQVVLHPLNTFEYVVVPMVFRSLKIADELAASSVVRGIESPYKKKGYYLNKMAVSDGVMIALFVSTAAMCILV